MTREQPDEQRRRARVAPARRGGPAVCASRKMSRYSSSQKLETPLILISGSTERRGAELGDFSLSLSLNYPLALQAAGGMPWLLPCLPAPDFASEAVRRADGVLLPC